LKICYLNLASQVFGGVRIVNEHCNRLADRGHEVGYCSLTGDKVEWLPVRYHSFSWNEMNPREWDAIVATEVNTWPFLQRMVTPARKFTFVQMLEWKFFQASRPRAANRVKMYYHWLDLTPITISKHIVKHLESCGHREVHLIPYGLDFDLFHPDEPIIPKGDKVRVLIEGHVVNEAKDVDQLAWQACQYVRDDIEVWGLSQFEPLYPFDQFFRLPKQEDLRRIYSACDILIKASKVEGKAASPFEAMACGCVPVCAINEGTDDLIYGKNCLLSQYNLLKLRHNLKKLVNDDSLRGELAQNGLEYVREHFQWDDKIDILEGVLCGQ
jgi:glycosyltransferase involved in cell wall biosynthesis